MCVIHIQVRVENGTVCAIAGSDAFLINTMDHGEWTSSFTVLGRVELDDAESWAAIRSIIDQPWYDTYQKSLIHLQMMRNATHIHWKWNRAHRHHSLSVLSCFSFSLYQGRNSSIQTTGHTCACSQLRSSSQYHHLIAHDEDSHSHRAL